MTLKVYREEGGLAGLYRGTIPTAIGVAPFVALNFYLYERFRLYALPPEIEHDASESRAVLTKLGCGALAGGLSQTITYPFDVIRRKMQVRMRPIGYHPVDSKVIYARIIGLGSDILAPSLLSCP